MLNIGVLASTNATDLQAVIDAINSKKLNAKIRVLISDKKNAYALERARKNGIKAVFLNTKNFKTEDKEKSRENFDREAAKIFENEKVQLILLIGYMRFISPFLVEKYRNRIMNIHPSLLPKYAGGMDRNVHEEVLRNNEKVTGATLHFVDEGADTGPIIMQKEVSIDKNENADSLKQKVQKAEQEIIVKSIGLFEKGKLKVINGRTIIE